MDPFVSKRRRRAVALAVVGLAFAGVAPASRVGFAPPAASAVQTSSAQQPKHVQTDESASLRQGLVGAVDVRGARIQVQGIWLDMVAGKTKLLRNGSPAGLDTLKVGENIRFTVAPESTATPSVRLIYVP
ncbi:MAG TPA: hypothetical protein VH041_13340 [Caldimonas sp.]|jgi:hypothetical protein|nr:hypothetical protein [Caldimonas sp.]HEX4235274.1 hypothetical protein [Caldimonas sp.]